MTSLPPVHSLPIDTLCAPVETTARALSATARRALIDADRGNLPPLVSQLTLGEMHVHDLRDGARLTDRGLVVRLHLIADDDDGWALAGWVLGIGHADSAPVAVASAARTLAHICAGDDVQRPAADFVAIIDADLIEAGFDEANDAHWVRPVLSDLGRERLAALTPADLAGEAVLRAVNLTGEGR